RCQYGGFPEGLPESGPSLATLARLEAHLGILGSPARGAPACAKAPGRLAVGFDGRPLRPPLDRAPSGLGRAETRHSKKAQMTDFGEKPGNHWWSGRGSNPRPSHCECSGPYSAVQEPTYSPGAIRVAPGVRGSHKPSPGHRKGTA